MSGRLEWHTDLDPEDAFTEMPAWVQALYLDGKVEIVCPLPPPNNTTP